MLLIQDLPNSLGDPAQLCCIFIYVAAPSLACSLFLCLPLSSSIHYSFIILLQLPYRPHFGEDKTCHLWVLSGGMMGDFTGEEDGCKECLLSPFFHRLKWTSLSLSHFFPCPTLLSFPLAVSLCNENLSLIEGLQRSGRGRQG